MCGSFQMVSSLCVRVCFRVCSICMYVHVFICVHTCVHIHTNASDSHVLCAQKVKVKGSELEGQEDQEFDAVVNPFALLPFQP